MRQIHTQVKIFYGNQDCVETQVNDWLSLKGHCDIVEIKQSVIGVANNPQLAISIFYKVEK